MNPTTTPSGRGARPADSDRGAWAAGGTAFAGVMMLVYGVLGVLQGIVGLAENTVYGEVGDYVFEFDITAWSWIHLVLGVAVAVVGWGVLSGAEWARALGVLVAALAVIGNFLWLPYQPVWGIISIAIGIFVIWALCTDRSGSVR
jgi:hypothetical protein